jgi:putative membrane protein
MNTRSLMGISSGFAMGLACIASFGNVSVAAGIIPVKVQSMAGPARLSSQDKSYLTAVAQCNIGEIKLQPLVDRRAKTSAAQQLALRFAVDHTRSLNQVKALAAQFNYPLPAYTDPADKAVMAGLESVPSGRFDAVYKQDMIQGHQMNIAKTRHEIKAGSNPQVITFAKQTLMVLQRHLQLANTLPPVGSQQERSL